MKSQRLSQSVRTDAGKAGLATKPPAGASVSIVGIHPTIGNQAMLRALVQPRSAYQAAGVMQRDAVGFGEMLRAQRQAAAGTTLEKQKTTEKKPAPKIEAEPDQFVYTAGLNGELKTRFNRMVIKLKENKIKFAAIGDLRPRAQAHIVSTAYHIRERGAVPITDLQGLTGGKDADGNVWYKPEWVQVSRLLGLRSPRPATVAEVTDEIKTNALALAEGQGSDFIDKGNIRCAYEGYEPDDVRRKPNVSAVPISNHVTGQAIDLSGVDWAKFGGAWTTGAREFVAGFGLTRPYSPEASTYCIKEHWHFELAPEGPPAIEAAPKDGGVPSG